jgi:tetratricopeptide (TPR) repeat protein
MLEVVARPDPTSDARACQTLGFALYDARRYEEALGAFERMAVAVNADEDDRAIAVTWQGHMLDLLGRRNEAIARYQEVAGLGLESSVRFDRYGLSYAFTPYAKERIEKPFVRLENRDQY